MPKNHITQTSFLHTSPPPPPSSSHQTAQESAPTTIFFITGNPGLIGYYHTFLSLLVTTLAPLEERGQRWRVFGRSLAGFDVDSSTGSRRGTGNGDGCYDLEDQINFVQHTLDGLMREPAQEESPPQREKQKVILIGHSVGSYIAMEILRRHRERSAQPPGGPGADCNFDIIGGIMLFPTIVDIAASPSGQKLTVSLPFHTHTHDSLACVIYLHPRGKKKKKKKI